MNLPTVILKLSKHNGLDVVQIIFEKNEKIIQLLREDKSLRWSKTMGCWYLPAGAHVKKKLFEMLKGNAWLDYSELGRPSEENVRPDIKRKDPNVEILLKEGHARALEDFRKWMLSRRYSQSTIDTYCDALGVFLRHHNDQQLCEISNKDLIEFNNNYILKNKLSSSYQNQVVNGVKLFFSTVENRTLNPDLIHRPKRAKLLPNVLSKEEVKAILNSQSNVKHKAMLSLIYSCGLRMVWVNRLSGIVLGSFGLFALYSLLE